MTELKEFDLTDFLTDEKIKKEYLNQVIKNGDLEELKRALFYISKSYGVENIAKKSNLNRESFYKIFKPNSKPRFESIFKIINALGYNIRLA